MIASVYRWKALYNQNINKILEEEKESSGTEPKKGVKKGNVVQNVRESAFWRPDVLNVFFIQPKRKNKFCNKNE